MKHSYSRSPIITSSVRWRRRRLLITLAHLDIQASEEFDVMDSTVVSLTPEERGVYVHSCVWFCG